MTPLQVARQLPVSAKSAFTWHAHWWDGGVTALQSALHVRSSPSSASCAGRTGACRSRSAGRPNATRTQWPRGSKRSGRGWKDGGGPGRVAVLRGRVEAAAAAKRHGPRPGGRTPRVTVRVAGSGRIALAGLPQARRRTQLVFRMLEHHRCKRDKRALKEEVRLAAECGPPAAQRTGRAGVGQPHPPRRRRDARADRGPAWLTVFRFPPHTPA